MNYLHWDEKIIDDFSEKNISDMYDRGYVFTRVSKGMTHQTRSARIDLSKFTPTSENRRIMKKTSDISLKADSLPMKDYDWSIGKLAKDFYENKFGPGIMSAQKIKELLTDPNKSNFNTLLRYSTSTTDKNTTSKDEALSLSDVGLTICYSNKDILHYSYPFYDLDTASKDMGMGMMIRAIVHAQEAGARYIYLGSLQRPGDTYKLQLDSLEWFDGGHEGIGKWTTDMERAKEILTKIN
jgi:arginyl-tRNA--protein-N-Asp/Glu arginylyltransferase